MPNPFQAHARLQEQYEKFTGGTGDDGQPQGSLATLTFNILLPNPLTVPCTHMEISGEAMLVIGGFSPGTMVMGVEVRSALLKTYVPKKGHKCSLKITPTSPALPLQVWSLNIQPGGEIFRFILVDANYHA